MNHIINNDRIFSSDFVTGSSWLPWKEDRSVYFGSGKEGIIALLDVLGLCEGDPVLIPSYVPEGVLAPLLRRRMRVIMYPITEDLGPDWEHFESLIAEHRPKLAVLIHYFGVYQDAERFARTCRSQACLMLEDLAHVLRRPESAIGIEGDVILYSIPKMLPSVDGAVLECRSDRVPINQFRYRPDVRRVLYRMLRWGQLAINTVRRRYRYLKPVDRVLLLLKRPLQSYRLLMLYFHHPGPMAASSSRLVHTTDFDVLIRTRRAFELRYREGLRREAFEPYPSPRGLPQDWCSIAYPVRVKNRSAFIHFLQDHGIQGLYFTDRWDFFPPGEVHERGRKAFGNHFLFPTAAGMTLQEIDRVIAAANAWAESLMPTEEGAAAWK